MNNQWAKRLPARGADGDRLPPHNDEAERGALGCVLLDSSCFDLCRERIKSPAVFYSPQHAEIWLGFLSGHTNPFTLRSYLSSAGKLDQIGGQAYISQLMNEVPSPAMLPEYLKHLLFAYSRRRLVQSCLAVADNALSFAGSEEEWADDLMAFRSDLGDAFGDEEAASKQVWSVGELHGFDADNDPNAVIGVRDGRTTRYLCRGYGAWLVGPSGVGKSSLITQFAFSLALGISLFGIQPVRALRVLIIQAENDQGDSAEMTQGICRSLDIEPGDARFTQLQQNIKFVTERRTVGDAFCTFLRREIVAHQADIVFVDPLLSFAGIDVARQVECSRFLRHGLNPVLADTGAVLFCAHHTGKPKEEKGNRPKTAIEIAYAGIGSSELVNWARAVMVLVEDSECFKLMLAKRGARAAATHPEAECSEPEYTTTVYLRHAQDRIFWDQIPAPVEPEEQFKERKKTISEQFVCANLHEVLSTIPEDGESANSLGQRLHEWGASNGIRSSETKCRTDVLFALANKQVGKLILKNKKWFRGANE